MLDELREEVLHVGLQPQVPAIVGESAEKLVILAHRVAHREALKALLAQGTGERAIVLDSSGVGKSTVLNTLGGMDTAGEGHVVIDGNDIATYYKHGPTRYCRDDVGSVFQFYNLVQNLTACGSLPICHCLGVNNLLPLNN